MNETSEIIYTLLTSKSALSSISFSSDDNQENKGGGCNPRQVHASCPCCDSELTNLEHLPTLSGPTSCINNLDKSATSRLTASSSLFNQSQTTLDFVSIKPSVTTQGKLVARVLPMQHGDYDTQKSMARMDPAPLINSLSLQEKDNTAESRNSPDHSSLVDHGELQLVETPPTSDNPSSVVALDLYLIRSEYIQDPKNHLHSENCNCHQAQEHLIETLINSVDLSRNNSSHVGFTHAQPRSNMPRENIFHLHMNRSSNESAARTLRRLEVSTTRKLKEMHPGSKKCIEENLSFLKTGQSLCKLITLESVDNENEQQDGALLDELGEGEDDTDGYSCCVSNMIDVSELSSRDMWHKCAIMKDTWKLAFAIPSAIIPWRLQPNTSASLTMQPISMEWVQLDIVPNPPTIVSSHTFENFTSHLFTGVPIALQTTILYATHAVIAWFADEELVLYDSNVYTPTISDVGKRISVLITPIRSDHNGEGCQEAYSFTRLVEPLPKMPIVELRQNWIHRKQEGTNYLRVMTVSSCV